MNRSYRYRLYPTPDQEVLLAKTFGCCRKVWNLMLAEKIERMRLGLKPMRQTPAQYKGAHPYLKEVDSMALINVQLSLEKAMRAARSRDAVGFPKFKSKKRTSSSYTTNRIKDNISIGNRDVKLPKLGKVRAKIHRRIPNEAAIKGATVSRNAAGEYYVSVLLELPEPEKLEPLCIDKSVGLDFSMPEFFVGTDIAARHPFPGSKIGERLAREQQVLKRKKKGSKNYYKQQRKLARLYLHAANQRKDYLHKTSREIANQYDVVGVENLNLKGISQTLHFGKRVGDGGWACFVHFLTYKTAERGAQTIKVARHFPSSKLCSTCGYKNDELTLRDRKWACSRCGAEHNRDDNAAENIRREAVRIALETNNRRACGDSLDKLVA